MKSLEKRLAEKGWAKKDIAKAINLIEKAKQNKHPKIKLLDKAVYWLSLLIAIIGNLVISVALVPFLLVLSSFQLYAILIVIGISFGLLFELLLRKIENLAARHHIFLGILIPSLAVLNFVVVLNNTERFIGIKASSSPLIIGSIYAIVFMLPYIVYNSFLKNRA